MNAVAKSLSGFPDLPLKSVWTAILLIIVLVVAVDRSQLTVSIGGTARSLTGTLPYMVLAIVTVASLKAAGAESAIAGAFRGREVRMIFLAAVVGGLAPFCSCEVIPFVAGLLAVGVPLSAIMAFWLSSPLIDPASFMIAAGALGWEFAVAKAVAAVGAGLLGGFVIRAAASGGLFASPLRARAMSTGCGGGCSASPLSGKPVWQFWNEPARRETFIREALSNGYFLLKWLTLAYLIETLMIAYVPAEQIGRFVGGEGLGPIVLSTGVGMVAYLNGYAAPPLVAGLLSQGMSLGAAMAFMIGGAISSLPAMTAVFPLVRRAVFASYILLGCLAAILSGLTFQAWVGLVH